MWFFLCTLLFMSIWRQRTISSCISTVSSSLRSASFLLLLCSICSTVPRLSIQIRVIHFIMIPSKVTSPPDSIKLCSHGRVSPPNIMRRSFSVPKSTDSLILLVQYCGVSSILPFALLTCLSRSITTETRQYLDSFVLAD